MAGTFKTNDDKSAAFAEAMHTVEHTAETAAAKATERVTEKLLPKTRTFRVLWFDIKAEMNFNTLLGVLTLCSIIAAAVTTSYGVLKIPVRNSLDIAHIKSQLGEPLHPAMSSKGCPIKSKA